FDEVAARRTDWAEAVAPLQLQWFNSTNAATEFFHHLSGLQHEQAELREIYWYLLALGFKGQYYFENEAGAGELAKLRALHAPQLPQPPADLQLAQARLCPQPYAQPDPPPGPAPHSQRWRLPGAVAAAVLTLLLSLWLAQGWMDSQMPPAGLAAQVTQHLQRRTCTALRAEQGADGVLRVRGFVPLQEDIDKVQREVAALAGPTPTQVQLQWRPWPYCEVVDILQPHQLRNERLRQRLALSASGVAPGVLREGDSVSLQVRAPAHEGVMWVDYYTADGAVVHLRAQGQRRVPFTAGQQLVFGEDLPSSWLVSPPFGPVLVTVIAVPAIHAVAPAEPEPYELASAYLLRLRAMLAASGAAAPAVADVLFLQTRER
ncbi:MAG: type IV / vi secretion system, dotu, partial [Comamonadaceae bacterium]